MSLLNQYFSVFVQGFGHTLLASIIALIGSLVLGTLFAIMQVSSSKTGRIIGNIYVQVFRNIPLLIITLFLYLAVAKVIKMTGFVAGTVGLTLYTSAFIAESVRAGILSIEAGQMEGARANGLTFNQAMRVIILPQAFKVAIPSLGNQFINLVKNSSILAFVGGLDLMYQGNLVAASSFDTFTTYIIIGVFYLVITMPLSYYVQHLETKLKKKA
ncbi:MULTISPECIES: amino acid ABC transporter permease [Fructobacillus]|jgi:aspartate/glutamate/glutamine transport system permease protein|uniref:Permease component (HisM) n=1 Tax=Fructobacillus cardui TaxID=2893170 RepID=A0ABN9Z1Z6_9LACO|nr:MULTISPECIES: amino acid ABC transporter permease [Fructobacillus]CAK1229887.1 ABC-type amino acid transport system [Fructobacillus tropaeoli]KMK53787.1 putative glutamine ABC transporter permease protein GlnM [Fructobacillus sp. EFB-N1]MCK8627864.1 amino acid ABC transporter permease [Fructobacillus cardui]CAK1221877.1 ABC-type amino acid transport system [Fructobacillus cardui]CAK1243649.1 ABC-type amino acid transport system [Fructobacillus cardui]